MMQKYVYGEFKSSHLLCYEEVFKRKKLPIKKLR